MIKNEVKKVNTLSLSLDFEKRLLAENLNFRVHSVYNRVLNLVDENDDIFAIVLKTIDNAPHTLRVDSKLSFKKQKINQEDEIQIVNKQIIISNKLVIDFKDYQLYQSQLRRKINLKTKILKANLKAAYAIIEAKGKYGGAKYFYQKKFTADNFSKKAATIEKEFAKRADNYILAEKKDPQKIIGLGMGLTPTGDDFLLGYFLTMALIDDKYSKEVFKNLKNELEKIEFSTTDLSKAMLKRALELKVRENIKKLIFSFNKNNEDFKFYLKKVLKIGSSSGTDISTGIMTAYQEILANKANGGKKCILKL